MPVKIGFGEALQYADALVDVAQLRAQELDFVCVSDSLQLLEDQLLQTLILCAHSIHLTLHSLHIHATHTHTFNKTIYTTQVMCERMCE